ncbi:MAG: radical SAM family heme chaperone HemW [Candidatus Omnitrophica bacterium]|nr:radical SAM family heme chaperone HemW [Candidatus Omnitrophota bacterium]MCF7891748.1 radical SAM family heme chaperone HemW [Candidatus Omnitrophota bacterium]MCF7895534.1 radical SAM family heme chaperone HemW [Candidatus Omnitrophota bacterium]MCF7897651.1 radical SAM family heme chaperone HemW [Candidatus Omnitrophota bacterium]MCF7909439.1 radical SAM family heme chaperone HemW [Candidatus Omnitrophota bacterium]
MVKSLYIHIPFCQSRCAYCDFYSTVYSKDLAASFVLALAEQLKRLDYNFETIYIGGGTPTILDIDLTEKLLKELQRLAGDLKEFTIEANPESLDADKIKLFLDYGANRISIGCQSFDDQKLKFLGRAHCADQALKSLKLAKKIGFDNISIDLIYGLPDESSKAWGKELARAGELPITHLSAYMLTYEKETRLFKRLQNKKFLPLAADKVAGMYKQLISQLAAKNIFQYEISNFAKTGCRSIHNCRYWENESYLGLGPSASSFLGGLRRKNISSLEKYITALKNGKQIWDYSEKLSPLAAAKETAALKIRTAEGLDFSWFLKKTGFDFLKIEKEALPLLLKQKLIKYSQGSRKKIQLTRKGFLFADTVSSAFL